jgi:hypothetical protein
MADNGDSRKLRSVTVLLGNAEGRIEKILAKGTEPEKVRISCWKQGQQFPQPLDISENQLVDLLQKAVRAGILSSEFVNNLHSEFEI